MKVLFPILLLLTCTHGFSQDSITTPSISFQNDLDRVSIGDSFLHVKKVLGQPNRIQYGWGTFDFGGPRIKEHIWTLNYKKLSCEIECKRWTGKFDPRPPKSGAKVNQITILEGSYYLDSTLITIGTTTREEIEQVLIRTNYETYSDFIIYSDGNRRCRFVFNAEGILEKVML